MTEKVTLISLSTGDERTFTDHGPLRALVRVRADEWSRGRFAPCRVCKRGTHAEAAEAPLHFECSSMPVTGHSDWDPDRELRRHRSDPNRRWSPWGRARFERNRHERRRHPISGLAFAPDDR
jgi:hypothetical protein